MELLIIRNPKITAKDLPVIQAVVNEHWDKGRTHISRELCRHWNWVQPSGHLKDMACRELLMTLYRKGLIDCPPPQYTPKNVDRTTTKTHVEQNPINCTLKKLGSVRVKLVRYIEHETIYNSLVDQFHYLGYSADCGQSSQIHGVCRRCSPGLHWLWGSAAWAVKFREQFTCDLGLSDGQNRLKTNVSIILPTTPDT